MKAPLRGAEAGSRIGPYKLLEILGEGGMGTVWLAEQTEPVKRRVALKVIKLGMDTKEVVARFESERQALAVMDHPSIAKVLGAGVTGTGQPYFAMEQVKGVDIREYCDTHRLSVGERVRLFQQVCGAVQHAHQKGIIHRDLKPSNVLVTVTEGGGPLPKVIDFGVAKAVGSSLTDTTLVTTMGQMIGTPAYMSPEQAERSGLDVDTRTDVYSLGMMLYELLAGALPFDRELLRKPAMVLPYLLRETDVPRPSTRLGALPDTHKTVAEHRATDIGTLRRTLSGDLDWIVMKAMEKDRTRRYETVNGLSLDLERYLTSEPVLARPPSATYRATRFVGRNRTAVVAGAALAVALVAGVAGTTVGMLRARASQAEAVAAQARALAEARTAQEVATFLTGLFEVSNPSESVGDELTARQILDRGAERIRTELGDQPLVQARLMETIGAVYRSLYLFPEAKELIEESLEIRERELGPDAPEVGSSLLALSRVLPTLGEHDRHERNLERARDIYEAAEGSRSLGFIRASFNLGGIYRARGERDRAETAIRAAISGLEAWEPRDAPIPQIDNQLPAAVLARGHGQLGRILQDQGDWQRAEELYRSALDTLHAILPSDHPWIQDERERLGWLYRSEGRLVEADSVYRAALASNERVFGPGHVSTASLLSQTALLSQQLGNAGQAADMHDRAIAIYDSAYGSRNSSTALAKGNRAVLAQMQGEYAHAESLFRDALSVYEAEMGAEHPGHAWVLYGLATTLEEDGRHGEAVPVRRKILEVMSGAHGATSIEAGFGRQFLAQDLARTGASPEAERILREGLRLSREAQGVESEEYSAAVDRWGGFLMDEGRTDEGLDAIRGHIAALEAQAPTHSERLATRYLQLSRALLAAARHDEAIQAAQRAVELHESESTDTELWGFLQSTDAAWEGYASLGREAEGRPLQSRALRRLREELTVRADTTDGDFAWLARLAERVGEPLETIELYYLRRLDFITVRAVGRTSWEIEIRTGLASLYEDPGMADRAERNFLAGIAAFDARAASEGSLLDADDREIVRTFLARYVTHLDEAGRTGEAAAVRARAAAIGD